MSSGAPITERVLRLSAAHHTSTHERIAQWRMSQATIDAMLAEHQLHTGGGKSNTLFGAPLVVDDYMVLGAVDLVPEHAEPYPPTENRSPGGQWHTF